MSRNSCVIPAPSKDVYNVLIDARAYSKWVVGPRRIVHVDEDWPQPGSSFVHEEAVGPVTVRDETVMVEAEPDRSIVLRAKLRPFGAIATIDVRLEDAPGGTRVTMREKPTEGPIAVVWNIFFDAFLWLRNVWALRRLKRLVLQRKATPTG